MRRLLQLLIVALIISCANPQNDNNAIPLTKETTALYNNLKNIAGNKFLFGHQDAIAYGIGWKGGEFNSDVEKVCGDFPAVYGWDIGHIDSTMNLDSVSFTDMRSWIISAYRKGGIITMGWHEKNLATGGSSWDNSKVVDKILTGGSLNDKYIAQLDKVADFILSLKTSEGVKVPVIFRPFHEHNGGWFWWGNATCSDEEYIQLWQITHNYLRIKRKVDNILFTYSTDAFTGREEYLARYPGDEYVDILGWDDYKSIKTNETRLVFHDRIEVINTLAIEKDKVAALSETGYETIPNDNWWTDVLLEGLNTAPSTDRIAYLLVWRNARPSHHYAPYPGHRSSKDFIKFKNAEETVFLSDLPNMYQ